VRRAGIWTILLLIFALLAMACGQKPGVHVSTGGSGLGPGEAGGELAFDPITGEPLGEAGSAGGGSRTTRSGGGSGGEGAGEGGGSVAAGPGDRNGVFNDRIVIGFHAPATGAAPVRLDDLTQINLFSDWLASKGVKIHGRKLQFVFKDDTYSPSRAVEVCREFVERDKVFLLFGGAGTDQILACARYAATRGVPYISAGVTENTVKGLKNYFAISMSYPQQGKPLAQMIKNLTNAPGGPVYVDRCDQSAQGQTTDPFCRNNGSAKPKVAMVYSNTSGFTDGKDAFLREWKAVSGTDAKPFSITKYNIDNNAASSLVDRLSKEGFDVVYVLTSPTNWLAILRVAEGQLYAPRWVGVGLTKGIDLVADLGCKQSPNSFANSLFLNPWMSVQNEQATVNFRDAWARFGDDYRRHDIAWGLWGASVLTHSLFQGVGPDVGRSKFVATVEQMKNVTSVPGNANTGQIRQVWSTLNFSAANHLGANQAHLLSGSCSGGTGVWRDVAGKQFVSGF